MAELILCKFTFHYVSIKSPSTYTSDIGSLIFTFHYVSIKSLQFGTYIPFLKYLHSTMYLLNLDLAETTDLCCANLHSTMYLLNPLGSIRDNYPIEIYIPLCIY